ncbi:5249_t:CDS:2, partial [Funneliformis geosporum]
DIIDKGENGDIGIGFCTKSASLNKMPGCDDSSWGYHSDGKFYFENDGESYETKFCTKSESLNKMPGCDDSSWDYHSGGKFYFENDGESYGTEFMTGDTIGCCLNFRNNTVFYTRNGVNLDIAFRDLKKALYPCVGMMSTGGSVGANFGYRKFKYTDVYSLVLEYADDTLKDYLYKHKKLNWDDKYRLAFQLSSAVECLHDENIIHRDLHAKNILVHQNTIKLADFGLSRKITEASSDASDIFGVIPYIDPKFLNNNKRYKLSKKSDVYSVGVLLWQISSGRSPFCDEANYDDILAFEIILGKRENVIPKTPIKYSDLYKECWKYVPDERPDIQEVVSTLEAIVSPRQSNTTVDELTNNPSHEDLSQVIIYTSSISQTLSSVIPFTQFMPLVKEVTDVLNGVIDLYKTAQHNKNITKVLMERIIAANFSVEMIKAREDLFTLNNYTSLQRLIQVLKKMIKFIEEITQYNTVQKFLSAKSIEKQFKALCKDYDSSINLLNFILTVYFRINSDKEDKILKEDIEELLKFQEALAE